MARIQNTDSTDIDENVEQHKLSIIPDMNAQWYNHFGR